MGVPMTTLVTGSNGFLGTRLVRSLLRRGTTDVVCLVRPGSRRERLQRVLAEFPAARASIREGTLSRSDAAAQATRGCHRIYHLAAALSGSPAEMTANTVVASNNLLQGALRSAPGAHFVLVSSFGVYGVAALPIGSVIDERTPLEPHPQRRDPYSQTKLRQEQLFRDHCAQHRLALTVLRPGVIYGPGGSPLSARLGLQLAGLFFHFGGRNLLPLSYVDNCADAIVLAADNVKGDFNVINVHDDDLPTCDAYLRAYQKRARPLRSVRVPYPLLQLASRAVLRYHEHSRGQLPAILTPYRTASTWKGHRFDNGKLKSFGWVQGVSTQDGMERTFASVRSSEPGRAQR